MRKTNRQNSRLAQNKILIDVRIYSASQGQTLNLNKINTEFFSDSVKKNSQHVLTERSLVYNFSACAGKDLEFKQNLIFEFWQKCKLRLITRKTNSQNSRLAQNKILIGVRIYSARQGQTSSL